jgi:hypothetical protein
VSQNFASKKNELSELKQYCLLLEESYYFLSQGDQKNFKEDLSSYIMDCKEYDFKNGIIESYLCEPILVNKDYTKAIIPIIKRDRDLSGKRVDYIIYVSAKFVNKKWIFKVKKGWSESFGYENSYPMLSDTEIGIKVVRNLLLRKDIIQGNKQQDDVFLKDLYVLKE